MKNIENDYQIDYSPNKRIIIIIAVVLFIVTSPIPLIFGEGSSVSKLIDFISIIGLNLLIFAWCYYDSLERNESFGRGWGILILILGLLALVIYLFKSRGFKQGLIAVGKALLIFLVMIIGVTIAMFITVLILGTEL